MNDKYTDLSKREESSSTVSGLEFKLASSQSKILNFKEQFLMSSKKCEGDASAAASTE